MSRDRVSSTFQDVEIEPLQNDLIRLKVVPISTILGKPAEFHLTYVEWLLLKPRIDRHFEVERRKRESCTAGSGLLRTA